MKSHVGQRISPITLTRDHVFFYDSVDKIEWNEYSTRVAEIVAIATDCMFEMLCNGSRAFYE
jgi:hypothetical protein